jgi:hypothetical protein
VPASSEHGNELLVSIKSDDICWMDGWMDRWMDGWMAVSIINTPD